jgi:hypothetical protein
MARFFVALLLPFVIFAQTALAKSTDPREVQARKDCLTGKVDSGVALLVELFTDTGNPTYIFNQARCYQQNARAADALNTFKEYLRVAKDISPRERTAIDQHMAECRAMLAEHEDRSKESKPAAETSHVVGSAAKPLEPAAPAENSARADLTSQPDHAPTRADDSSIFSRWWFWTIAAVVVAGGVTTTILLTRGSGTKIPDNTLGSQNAF